METTEFLRKFAALQDARLPWEAVWKDITDYILPRRSIWELEGGDGKAVGDLIYDGTALSALQLLADGLQGYLVAPAMVWFRLKLQNRTVMEQYGVMDWLEEVERIMYAELQRSNFYEATNEFFSDAGGIGTAYMLEEDDPIGGRLCFSTRHPKEMFISENSVGAVDTVFRKMRMTVRQMVDTFGDENAEAVLDMAERTPYAKFDIIHGVFPRTDRDITKISSDNKKFASVYLDVSNNKVVRNSGYDTNPYFVLRWRKNSDEIFGRSPAADALPDILRINQVSKTLLQAAQLAVEPPLNVPSNLRGLERIIPRGLNYYDDPTRLVTPINLQGNYPIGRDQGARIEEIIKNHFRVDFFMMLQSIDREMTAREVAERAGEKSAILGATIGRINSEFLDPVIERTFALLAERGVIPEPPQALAGSGTRIEIEFVGPLAQSQKRYLQSQGIGPSLEMIMPLSQVQPAIMDNLDFDILSREIMEANGMPQKVVREVLDVQKMREMAAQEKAKQQQMMMMQQQQQVLMQNSSKLNEEVVPGSTLEGIAKAQQQAQQQQAMQAQQQGQQR